MFYTINVLRTYIYSVEHYATKLHLKEANEYKVSKAAEGIDWESVKTDLFIAALPDDDSTRSQRYWPYTCKFKDLPAA